jgi:hypothetical protein
MKELNISIDGSKQNLFQWRLGPGFILSRCVTQNLRCSTSWQVDFGNLAKFGDLARLP